MNRTKIDWPELDYTWNPIVGCQNNCGFCYARSLHNKRHEAYKNGKRLPVQYAKPFNEIQYFPERTAEPFLVKKPSVIFVGSMTDIFGPWVDHELIQTILNVIYEANQHTFMLLTKFPECYACMPFFPPNVILGATFTMKNIKRETTVLDQFRKLHPGHRKFISLEPILGPTTLFDLRMIDEWIDLVIVGSMTGGSKFDRIVPDPSWLYFIAKNIYYKKSIRDLFPGLPQWENKQQDFKLNKPYCI